MCGEENAETQRRRERSRVATALWSACDLSPLWFGAERRWSSTRDLPSHFGQRGSAANQSGDKSPHSTRRRSAMHQRIAMSSLRLCVSAFKSTTATHVPSLPL